MLDIKLVRENKQLIINDLKKRHEEELIPKVDELIDLDKEARKLKKELDTLRSERNKLTQQIQQQKDNRLGKQEIISRMKEINSKIKELEKKYKKLESKVREILEILPNITHNSVPEGTDEEENKVIKKWGEKRKFDFQPLDHIDLGEKLDMFELERAAKVAGSRFYYLKNEGLMLEKAIISYALDFLRKEGFEIFSVPMIVNEKALFGTGFLPRGKEDLYKIEGEDKYLIGTAEVSLGALHMDEVLLKDELPKKYAGISSCFRTEAGSHGRDTKGIFRVHQFEKVEMFLFTHPEDSWKMHDYLLGVAENFYQSLGLPYQVVNICSGDLGWVAAKKYDIEVWLPGQGKYREVVSCSNCTDYQARRLNIKYREKEGAKPEGYVHTLNSTLTAIQRTIIAIMENYQQKDGSIKIPDVLVPYFGKEEIRKV